MRSKNSCAADRGKELYSQFHKYFKIGVSGEYVLMRLDFPMESLSPSDFSRLCKEVFKINDDEVHHGR